MNAVVGWYGRTAWPVNWQGPAHELWRLGTGAVRRGSRFSAASCLSSLMNGVFSYAGSMWRASRERVVAETHHALRQTWCGALSSSRRSGGRQPVVPPFLEHVVGGVTDDDANAGNSSTHDAADSERAGPEDARPLTDGDAARQTLPEKSRPPPFSPLSP